MVITMLQTEIQLQEDELSTVIRDIFSSLLFPVLVNIFLTAGESGGKKGINSVIKPNFFFFQINLITKFHNTLVLDNSTMVKL